MKADRTFTSKRASKSHASAHLTLSALALALVPTSHAMAQLVLEAALVSHHFGLAAGARKFLEKLVHARS